MCNKFDSRAVDSEQLLNTLLCIYLFKCFMCGMKDSLRSKTTPNNLVSSTTRTGVPFSSRVGSGWGLRNLQNYMHTVFRGRELEYIGVSPVSKFIETLLEVTLNNMDMLRSVADQKIVDI